MKEKLTETKLRSIIKEEIQKLNEAAHDIGKIGKTIEVMTDGARGSKKVKVTLLDTLKNNYYHTKVQFVEYPKGYLNVAFQPDDENTIYTDPDVGIEEVIYDKDKSFFEKIAKKHNLKVKF